MWSDLHFESITLATVERGYWGITMKNKRTNQEALATLGQGWWRLTEFESPNQHELHLGLPKKCTVGYSHNHSQSFFISHKKQAWCQKLRNKCFLVFTNGEERQISDIRSQNKAPMNKTSPTGFIFSKKVSRKHQLFSFLNYFFPVLIFTNIIFPSFNYNIDTFLLA